MYCSQYSPLPICSFSLAYAISRLTIIRAVQRQARRYGTLQKLLQYLTNGTVKIDAHRLAISCLAQCLLNIFTYITFWLLDPTPFPVDLRFNVSIRRAIHANTYRTGYGPDAEIESHEYRERNTCRRTVSLSQYLVPQATIFSSSIITVCLVPFLQSLAHHSILPKPA